MNSALQKTRIWSSTHEDDQVRELSRLTNLEYHAFAPAIRCVSRGKYSECHDEGEGEFGIGILSRFPVLDTKVITFSPYKKKTPRNALSVLLDLSGGGGGGETLWFVCTHLGCHTGPEQLQQAIELFRWTEDLRLNHSDAQNQGLLLCGDTNSPPGFKAVAALQGLPVYRPTVLRRGIPIWPFWAFLEWFFSCIVPYLDDTNKNYPNRLHDSWFAAGNGSHSSGTFPALGLPGAYWATCCRPIMKLDYIFFAGSGVNVILSKVLKNGDGVGPTVDLMASDHRPLIAKFSVGGARGDDGNGRETQGKRLDTHFDSPPTWERFVYDFKLLTMFVVAVFTIVTVVLCA